MQYTLTIGEKVLPYLVYYSTPIVDKVIDGKTGAFIDGEDKYVVIVVVSLAAFKGIKTRHLKLPIIKNVFNVYFHKIQNKSTNANQLFQEVNKTYDKVNLHREHSHSHHEMIVKDSDSQAIQTHGP